jgi:regulator of extracellular matrix RemA (YlzA/DUF370 family)
MKYIRTHRQIAIKNRITLFATHISVSFSKNLMKGYICAIIGKRTRLLAIKESNHIIPHTAAGT